MLSSDETSSCNDPSSEATSSTSSEHLASDSEGNICSNLHGRKPFRFNEKASIPMKNILDQIGTTPLVQLKRIPQSNGLKSKIYAKCEFMNPSGSIKDRVALGLLKKLLSEPDLLPKGGTLVSVNDSDLAISLAMVSALEGYQTVALIGEDVDGCKKEYLKALGAKTWIIPEVAGNKSCPLLGNQFALELARDFIKVTPSHSIVVSEHLKGTEENLAIIVDEICSQGVHPNALVIEVDTQEILSAISYKLLNNNDTCEIIAVEKLHGGQIKSETNWECIGATKVTCSEKDALFFTRELIREEGILCGPTGGAMLWAALEAIKRFEIENDKQIVVVICISESLSSSRKDFLSDEWMLEKGYYTIADIHRYAWWYGVSLGNLRFNAPPTVSILMSIKAVKAIFSASACEWLIVVDPDSSTSEGAIVGVSSRKLLKDIDDGKYQEDQSLRQNKYAFDKDFPRIGRDSKLGELEKLLTKYPYAVIFSEASQTFVEGSPSRKYHYPLGVATLYDIFEWVIGVENHHRVNSLTPATDNPIYDD